MDQNQGFKESFIPPENTHITLIKRMLTGFDSLDQLSKQQRKTLEKTVEQELNIAKDNLEYDNGKNFTEFVRFLLTMNLLPKSFKDMPTGFKEMKIWPISGVEFPPDPEQDT